MMFGQALDVRPLVLVVDDDDENAELRLRGLEDAGCDVIAVSSLPEALDSLRDGPSVDLIMTDNMLGQSAKQGGISLAYKVKSGYDAELPVVLYSFLNGLEDLSAETASMFALIKPRGTILVDGFDDFYRECRTIALGHRDIRIGRARERGDLFEGPVPRVRSKDLAPERTLDGVEETLIGLGYRLRLVSSDNFDELSQTVAVWLRVVDDQCEAQVCGQPFLHWEDVDEDSTLNGLVRVMVGYAQQLREADMEASAPMQRLKKYLELVVRSVIIRAE